MLVIEAHSLSDRREELVLSSPGSYTLANNTVDYQKGREADRQILRCHGPLTADFIIKVGRKTRGTEYEYIAVLLCWNACIILDCLLGNILGP